MNGDVQGLEQIQERLSTLERQNRKLKQVGATALTVAVSLLLMGQASPTRPVQAGQLNTIEASQFVLKDKAGRIRATLSIDEKPGSSAPAQLVLYDAKGTQRAKLDSGALPLIGGFTAISPTKKEMIGSIFRLAKRLEPRSPWMIQKASLAPCLEQITWHYQMWMLRAFP